MTAATTEEHSKALRKLNRTVTRAADSLAKMDEDLFDGYQTAREVLSHLVFWHREYVTIVRALADGHEPFLREGTFAELNAAATDEFAGRSLPNLARQLVILQEGLEITLRRLPDWEMNFPVKRGGRYQSVAMRVDGIEAHINSHAKRLKRALRHGKAWVKAYYSA
jgi:hypothetical protein